MVFKQLKTNFKVDTTKLNAYLATATKDTDLSKAKIESLLTLTIEPLG